MARKAPVREHVSLECSVCGDRYYRTSKNSRNTTGRLELKKHCRRCRKHTAHREKKK